MLKTKNNSSKKYQDRNEMSCNYIFLKLDIIWIIFIFLVNKRGKSKGNKSGFMERVSP